ncbi:MAG: MBL fold metallo-hydrolase [Actinomycetota bacterium]|nr:MBL fold metallo-hydrolase [Actinomycetota bacterium]
MNKQRPIARDWKVGNVTIRKVVELEGAVPGGPGSLLPDATPEALSRISWLVPNFALKSGQLRVSVQSFVIQTPHDLVVLDTGIGNGRRRTNPFYDNLDTDFLDRLNTAGAVPRDVTGVICTHLHVDHVGWNTIWQDGEWVPTFPNATYYVARPEWEGWTTKPERIDAEAFKKDSIDPVSAAGLLCLVEADQEILPGVRLMATPGHTPGHTSVVVASRDESATILGDVMLHPCQVARPDWTSPLDEDAVRAVETRKSILERYVDTGKLVLGMHFARQSGGYISHKDSGFRFDGA